MRFHYVERETPMTITVDGGREIPAVYADHLNDKIICVHCPEICDNINDYIGREAVIKFAYEYDSYSFNSFIKMKGPEVKDGGMVIIESVSDFIKDSRRAAIRVDMSFFAKIYEYDTEMVNGYKGELLCDARSDDLNMNGIRLFSDHWLDAPTGSLYTVGFTMPHGPIYLLPAKLMRKQPNLATKTYAYDYGFMFDFTHFPDSQDRLVTDMLAAKLKGSQPMPLAIR